MAMARPGNEHRIPSPAAIAALALLAAVLFAGAMTAPAHYDDEQYVAGAYFARHHALYRDFLSLQPPGYTALVSAVFSLVGGYYYLTAKLITWAFSTGTLVLLHSLLRSLGAGRAVSLVLLIGFLLSPFAMQAMHSSRNDIMPLFLLLVGIRLLVDAGGQPSRDRVLLFGAGLALGLAAATKLTYIYAGPVAALWLWRQNRNGVAALLLGGGTVALAMAPLLGDLDLIRFALVDFHQVAPFDWYRAEGQAERLEPGSKLRILLDYATENGNAAILLLGCLGAGVLFGRRLRGISGPALRPATGLIALLLAGAAIFCFQPTPSHPMYFASVAALGSLLAGALAGDITAGARPRLRSLLMLATLLPAAPAALPPLGWCLLAFKTENWTGIGAHRTAGEIAALLAEHGATGPVATLFPLVALDGNEVPIDFATGPFVFRSGHLYPAERIEALNAIAPHTLEARFAAAPPAAIVGGFESAWSRPMDAALLDYAARQGYRLVKSDLGFRGYRGGQVWIRSGPAP